MLLPCPTCGAHARAGTCACPHCGAKMCADRRTTTALVLGLALAGCRLDLGKDDSALIQPAYGEPIVDMDGDGWEAGDDCDDDDPEIHPEAEEIPGDGVDQNCNEDDDT